MNTRRLLFAGIAMLLGFLGSGLRPAGAEIDWNVVNERTLPGEPLDMAMSGDGQTLLILTKGKILLYSLPENKASETIPVDESFDSIEILPGDGAVAISSRATKNLKIIAFEVTKVIDVTGHPLKGNEKAPVTVAVFSDYQ